MISLKRLAPALLLIGLLSPASPAAETGFRQGLLWRLQAPGGAVSHVFGTIHVEDPRVLQLPAPVLRGLEESETFAMELVPDAASIAELGQRMQYPQGQALSDDLDPELYARTTTALAAYGMPEQASRRLRPWAALLVLSTPKAETGMVLDLKLYMQALEAGKTIAGLETVAEQVEVFGGVSLADQVTLLRETLDHKDQVDAINHQLVEVYLRRDLAAMIALQHEATEIGDQELTRRLYRRLIDERNPRMVERMLPLLRQGSAFVAVGALHLPGKTGVLQLLQQRGYRVTRAD